MPPLGLTDEEMSSIAAMASALPPSFRDGFLRVVAAKVSAFPEQARGPGLVHRLGIEAQREFLKGGMLAEGVAPKFRRGKYA